MEAITQIYSFYPAYEVMFIAILIAAVIPLVTIRLTVGSLWSAGTAIVLIVATYILWQLFTENKVQIVEDNLVLSSAMYEFSTPASTLDLEASHIVSDYEAARRLKGISLLGFNAGHFKNKAGDAVFLLTQKPPYAIIPVINGKKDHIIVSIGAAENLDRLKSLMQ